MKLVIVLCITLTTGILNLQGQTLNSESINEETAIQQVIDNLYGSFTIKNGILPDFKEIRKFFTEDARMGAVRNGIPKISSADDYLSSMEAELRKNKLQLLKEWEIKGKTEVFGHLAHRFSSYAVYVNSTDSIGERGIISYQLIKVNGKWRVTSMLWDTENDSQKLPERYLD
jgi:hypothetical protein